MKKCAYCHETKKLTREHIWPKCILTRMPNLDLKYMSSQKKFISSDLVISDVCADCNNIKLSKLDNYLCNLYDKYFQTFIENKSNFVFEFNYELLLRSLLKITYNSSRTVKSDANDFIKYRNFIKDGGENFENIVVKLDLVLPTTLHGSKLYPISARCGTFDVDTSASTNFIQRMIAINSFYFYILIFKDKFLNENSLNEFEEIFNRIPGTIIHPYRSKIEIDKFSNINAYDSHINLIEKTKDYLKEYFDKKSDS